VITLAEMTAWGNDDILAQIKSLHDKSMTFHHGFDTEGRLWFTRFEQFDKATQKRVVVWEDFCPDQRLSLFNAFGWVWLKPQQQSAGSSIWKRREETLTHRINVGQKPSYRSSAADPEDLDPKEVQEVYVPSKPV